MTLRFSGFSFRLDGSPLDDDMNAPGAFAALFRMADAVRAEIIAARRLFEKQGWPIIDVTRRSVEETAAAIINLLSGGRGQVEVLG